MLISIVLTHRSRVRSLYHMHSQDHFGHSPPNDNGDNRVFKITSIESVIISLKTFLKAICLAGVTNNPFSSNMGPRKNLKIGSFDQHTKLPQTKLQPPVLKYKTNIFLIHLKYFTEYSTFIHDLTLQSYYILEDIQQSSYSQESFLPLLIRNWTVHR